MYKRNVFFAVALASLLAAGCGSSGGAGDFNLISLEEEWQLGAQLSREVASQVTGRKIDCGHFIPEEAPVQTLTEIQKFLARCERG